MYTFLPARAVAIAQLTYREVRAGVQTSRYTIKVAWFPHLLLVSELLETLDSHMWHLIIMRASISISSFNTNLSWGQSTVYIQCEEKLDDIQYNYAATI